MRKADQIWIDTLRGQYANLPVDKVIAVARTGFAKTARAAAEKARIQTLTLEEATSANWHLISPRFSRARAVRHGFEQIRRRPIAFTRRRFEAFAVNDGDVAMAVFD